MAIAAKHIATALASGVFFFAAQSAPQAQGIDLGISDVGISIGGEGGLLGTGGNEIGGVTAEASGSGDVNLGTSQDDELIRNRLIELNAAVTTNDETDASANATVGSDETLAASVVVGAGALVGDDTTVNLIGSSVGSGVTADAGSTLSNDGLDADLLIGSRALLGDDAASASTLDGEASLNLGGDSAAATLGAGGDLPGGGASGLDSAVTASIGGDLGEDGLSGQILSLSAAPGEGALPGSLAVGSDAAGPAAEIELNTLPTATLPPAPGSTAPATTGTTLSSLVAGLSDGEITRYQQRCVEITANPGSYDRDLVALCAMIESASR